MPRIRVRKCRKMKNQRKTTTSSSTNELRNKLREKLRAQQRRRMPKEHRDPTPNNPKKGQPHQIPADQLIHTMFQEMGIHDEKAEQRVIERLKADPDISTMDHVTQLIKECLNPSSSAETDVPQTNPSSSAETDVPQTNPSVRPRCTMKPPSVSVD